ncbi:hypothetical protein VT84_33530 [Gemmata sp. SH-PL17]|uniref:IS66 family insertion sequence element accessory protein TnpA n=1 Tax=Gemmata sp. SH-PL17 TaxID=1630693 RepID=UPI00078BC1BF|nr:hypothetical protein [Gemmata sp. SH-PL17]AMV29235.1 hypothetical protein VT84_32875 [Gemmata sp. SH-PL17]AMV29365.1 hypothetical protein VT84_33530 [Gemmata sp. SH-PL17]
MPRPHLRDPKLEQFWRATVAKWATSGRNIRDFCRENKLPEPSFYAWRREIAARDRTPVAKSIRPVTAAPARRNPKPARPTRPARRGTSASAPTPRPSFVALRVVPGTPLELVLRSGHVLRVPPGYDANHLRAVVAALEGAPC